MIEVVPGLVRDRKRDGRCTYDRRAKRELVRRFQQPGLSVAAQLSMLLYGTDWRRPERTFEPQLSVRQALVL